jgi:hypothetical protein
MIYPVIGSGSNPLKKTPLPPGEGNIRINGFDPPPCDLSCSEKRQWVKSSDESGI